MQLTLNKLPWYGQVAVFAVVSVAAAVAFYYFYEAPAREQMAVHQRKLDGLRAEINRGMQIARRLPEFRAQVGDLEARLENLRNVLPEQKDVGDLLRRLQTLATQSNLEIRGFKPQAITTRQMHAEWPIALELDGTYHDLGLFFDKVSKVPRIINISSLHIKGRDPGAGPRATRPQPGQSPASISAECTAMTFVLVEQPEAAQGQAAAPGRPQTPGARPAAGAPARGAAAR
jgi:type IV pilus assembly protein PilO